MKTTGMKVTTSQLMLGAIYLLIAMNLEVFKIFGDSLFLGNSNRYILLTVIFSILAIFLASLQYGSKTPTYLFLISLPLIFRVIFAILSADIQGYSIYDHIQYCRGYLCIIFAFPIYYVLKYRGTSLRNFVKIVFLIAFASVLIKSFVSIYNFFTGTIIFPAVVYRDTWYRYGLLRMQPPGVLNISIPMGAFLAYTECKRSKRVQYYFMTILIIVFSAMIHGSRFTAIYQTAALIFIIMIRRKSQARSFILFLVFVIGAIIISETGIWDSIIGSFNITNQEFGGSSAARIIALDYFGKQISNHPIWGVGILGYSYSSSLHITSGNYAMGDLTDLGILYSVMQFGFIITMTIIILLVRLFTIGSKARKAGNEPYCILLWGVGLCLILSNITMDVFTFYSISVPIAIAIGEYCNLEISRMGESC